MNGTVRCTIFAAAISIASVAMAQSTVRELLDAGGRHLTAEETSKLVSNTRMTGETGQGYRLEFDMKGDGTFKGYVYPSGRPLAVWGKWNASESGAYCQQMRYSNGGVNDFCNSLYVLDGKYFVAGAGKNPHANPAARLQTRAFAPM